MTQCKKDKAIKAARELDLLDKPALKNTLLLSGQILEELIANGVLCAVLLPSGFSLCFRKCPASSSR